MKDKNNFEMDESKSRLANSTFQTYNMIYFGLAIVVILSGLVVAGGFRKKPVSHDPQIAEESDTAGGEITQCLLNWGALPSPKEHSLITSAAVSQFKVLKRSSDRDIFSGKGADWLMAEIAPENAQRLHAALKKANGVRRAAQFPEKGSLPKWWLNPLPFDLYIYTYSPTPQYPPEDYLAFSDGGTRVWLMRTGDLR